MICIQVRYFARLREKLGCEQERLQLDQGVTDIQGVCRQLARRGGVWAEELGGERPLMAAINEELQPLLAPVNDGDLLALFPPVTGG
jgi:sulfur-carrier protein